MLARGLQRSAEVGPLQGPDRRQRVGFDRRLRHEGGDILLPGGPCVEQGRLDLRLASRRATVFKNSISKSNPYIDCRSGRRPDQAELQPRPQPGADDTDRLRRRLRNRIRKGARTAPTRVVTKPAAASAGSGAATFGRAGSGAGRAGGGSASKAGPPASASLGRRRHKRNRMPAASTTAASSHGSSDERWLAGRSGLLSRAPARAAVRSFAGP